MSLHNLAGVEAAAEMGITRAVLARELSFEQIRFITKNASIETEVFVHGALCFCHSGQCYMSALIGRRSGNRGLCAQPCRLQYSLGGRMDDHPLSLKDNCLVDQIRRLEEAGVASLKIEGRMKSSYYAAVVTNAYRHAIDAAIVGAPLDPLWVEEVNKVSHRPYTTGFYFGDPGQYYHDATYFTDADVAAVVEDCDADGNAVLCQRNKFYRGDELELLTTDDAPVKFTVEHMYNSEGEEIDDTRHAMMAIHMRLPRYAERYSIVRKCR